MITGYMHHPNITPHISILHPACFYYSVTGRCESFSDIWNIHKKAIKKGSQRFSSWFSFTFCPDFVDLYIKPVIKKVY